MNRFALVSALYTRDAALALVVPCTQNATPALVSVPYPQNATVDLVSAPTPRMQR